MLNYYVNVKFFYLNVVSYSERIMQALFTVMMIFTSETNIFGIFSVIKFEHFLC